MASKYLYLLMFILVCESAGFIGAIFTSESVATWYTTIEKPVFNPPNWVFGPVWTTLYALMGLSAYMVFISGHKRKKKALLVFGGQLLLNILWSFAFFGLRSPLLGLVVIAFLWLTIASAIYLFYRISRNAAYVPVMSY